MPDISAQVDIPNRALFKAAEVCELTRVQPYVLRSWEAEFPDLGVAKNAGSPRVYRRVDVEQVLRIKHLLLVEGFKFHSHPKIEVHRPSVGKPFLYPNDQHIVAVAADEVLPLPVPLLALGDPPAVVEGASAVDICLAEVSLPKGRAQTADPYRTCRRPSAPDPRLG